MRNPESASRSSLKVLDAYLALSAREAKFRERIATQEWNTLAPDEKRTLQTTARKLAGNDLRFGSEHTIAILLLRYAMNSSVESCTIQAAQLS